MGLRTSFHQYIQILQQLHFISKVCFSFDIRDCHYFKSKGGFKPFSQYGCIRESGPSFLVFPMHINSNKFRLVSLIHLYRQFFRDPQHQFFSGAYFNTPAILFNTSALVVVLWLVTTLSRTNKRKRSLKKMKKSSKTKCNYRRFLLYQIC